MGLRLTEEQRRHVLERFRDAPRAPNAHASVWRRRAYAPMYIHDDALRPFREEVERRYPEYVVAFDVIFDSDGGRVDPHVDHESLGPFEVPCRWRALRDRHFLSIHTNLTADGGRLLTVDDWPLLSYLYYLVIATAGIFSRWHRALLWCTAGLVGRVGHACDNDVGAAHAFDNTRVHAVSAGAPRTSYVLRLVRRGRVRLTRASVLEGISRSAACQAFTPLLAIVASASVDVGEVNWRRAFDARSGEDAARRGACAAGR